MIHTFAHTYIQYIHITYTYIYYLLYIYTPSPLSPFYTPLLIPEFFCLTQREQSKQLETEQRAESREQREMIARAHTHTHTCK